MDHCCNHNPHTHESPVLGGDLKAPSFTLPLLALLFTLPLLVIHLLPQSLPTFLQAPLTQALLASITIIIGTYRLGKNAYRSLKALDPNMDLLILFGAFSAYLYSLYGLSIGDSHLYFESAASIIAFVMVGHYLESRAVTKAAADLNFVLASNQKPRLVLGSEVTLPAGEEINGDGEIIWGDGLIDESLLTGESKPIPKGVGDKVFGGTHLLSGTIRYRVNAVGSNSALGKVLQLVERAYVDRPAIQALGDRAAKIFIPSIIIVSLLTLLSALLFLPLHEALIRSIAVLVVACPCAVGLATPTAVMAGVGRAAKRGIIFKGGAPLETLANIEAIAFDKTGTLTEVSKGIPDLEVLSAGEKYDLAELTKIAVTLEEHSSHPLSKAIRLLGNSDPETLAEAREVVGEGVYGKGKDGREFFIGLSPKERTFSVTLSIDGEVVCGFRFADATKATLKEGAKEIVTYFRKVLREVYLLSGDSLPAVKQVGEALNLDEKNVMGELLPEDKLKALSEIQKSYKVCFVGDGINDAPSLAKADVGIAIGGGSDSALRSARVILLKGDLFLLKEAIQISKATYTTIKQNLWWAFIYNLSLVPFAAFGFISPTFAALAMGASDLLIVGNSIRLSTKKF